MKQCPTCFIPIQPAPLQRGSSSKQSAAQCVELMGKKLVENEDDWGAMTGGTDGVEPGAKKTPVKMEHEMGRKKLT